MRLIYFISIALLLIGCQNDDDKPCECTIRGTIYISSDNGANWYYSGLDGRSGEQFPCDFDGRELIDYSDAPHLTKTVWECID